jgi:hypothetical protein
VDWNCDSTKGEEKAREDLLPGHSVDSDNTEQERRGWSQSHRETNEGGVENPEKKERKERKDNAEALSTLQKAVFP